MIRLCRRLGLCKKPKQKTHGQFPELEGAYNETLAEVLTDLDRKKMITYHLLSIHDKLDNEIPLTDRELLELGPRAY